MASTLIDRNLIDRELVAQAAGMRERAEHLRVQADAEPQLLGRTYRRRASELELEAFLVELSAGLPDDQVHAPAA
jgi:hypothetical protein